SSAGSSVGAAARVEFSTTSSVSSKMPVGSTPIDPGGGVAVMIRTGTVAFASVVAVTTNWTVTNCGIEADCGVAPLPEKVIPSTKPTPTRITVIINGISKRRILASIMNNAKKRILAQAGVSS